MFSFSKIWFLIDPDEDKLDNGQLSWDVLKHLVSGASLLTNASAPILFRYFIPEEFQTHLYNDVKWIHSEGPRCIVHLTWDEDDLRKMLQARMEVCSDNRYESLGQISEDEQVDERVIAKSQNRPRYLIWICNEIFHQHCLSEASSHIKKITKREVNDAIAKTRDIIKQGDGSKEDKLISLGEGQKLEFKSTMRWNLKSGKRDKEMDKEVAQAVSAFMNTDGGTLIVGVADDGKAIGLEYDFQTLRKQNEDGFQAAFINEILNGMLELEVSDIKGVHISFDDFYHKRICKIEIEASSQPVFVKLNEESEFYMRQGNITKKLNMPEAVSYIQKRFNLTKS